MKRTIVLALILKVGFLGIAVEQLTAQDKGDEPAVIINGDINGDGGRNITDALQLLGWLFGDAPEPVEFKVDGDQSARISELEEQLENTRAANKALEEQLQAASGRVNLAGANLIKGHFNELDLQGANLEGTDFRGSNLYSADLRSANLQNANLAGADLRGVNLTGANIDGVDLRGVTYWEGLDFQALLEGTRGEPAFYPDDSACELVGTMIDVGIAQISTSLKNMNLQGCQVEGGALFGPDFTRANLSGINMRGSYLSHANFSQANLEGADLSISRMWRGSLNYATLAGSNLSGTIFTEVALDRVDLGNANFTDSLLERMAFEGANLEGADFRGARLDSVDFYYSNLQGANLEGVDLQGANLEGSDLRGAILDLEGTVGVPEYMPWE